jgi:hypothetical protein
MGLNNMFYILSNAVYSFLFQKLHSITSFVKATLVMSFFLFLLWKNIRKKTFLNFRRNSWSIQMNHLCSSLHWISVNRELTLILWRSQTSEHYSKGHEVELIHENMNIILLIFVLNPSYFRIPIYRSSRFNIWSPSTNRDVA